jgi:hypothetical protein
VRDLAPGSVAKLMGYGKLRPFTPADAYAPVAVPSPARHHRRGSLRLEG